MGELPLLADDGSVRFPSRDALADAWDEGPGRGLLFVRTATVLTPLQLLTVRLEADGMGALTLEAEVIRPETGRTVLRLLAGPQPLPAHNPFAATAAMVMPASNPFAATTAVVTPASNPFASPPSAPPPTSTAAEPPAPTVVGADFGLRAGPLPTPVAGPVGDGDEDDRMPPPPGLATAPARPSPRVVLDDNDDDGDTMPPPSPPPARPLVTPPVIALDAPEPEPPKPMAPAVIALDAPEPEPPKPPARAVIALDAPEPEPPKPPARAVIALDAPAAMAPDSAKAPTTAPAVPGLAVMTPPVKATVGGGAPIPSATATQSIDSSPLRAALPPYFSGDCLRFGGPEDLRAGRGDLLTVGALLAVSEATAPATAVEVRLAVGHVETRGRVKVTISQAQKGTVVVMAQARDDWRALLDELDAALRGGPPPTPGSSAAPASPPATASASVTLQFPKQGSTTNPVTVQGILAMPLHRSVSEQDLKTPTVPLLLRWLRTTRGIFRLDLTADGQPAHTCVLVDGREVRTTVSLATLGKSMASHRYDYTLTELPRAPTMSHTGRSLHLIVEVVRGLLAQHDPDEIARVFPHTKDPRAVRAVGSVADALGFSGAHARLVKSSLQGDETVAGVTRSAAGARTAWDVLVALELFGGLVFSQATPEQPPADEPASTSSGDVSRPALLDKDHFGALGLHWSCSPHDVTEAWQRARREYGQGGMKRPADPRLADEVMKRLEEAWRVLGNADSRRSYRRATFNMVWPHQATLLVQQAKLALYRKDIAEAKNLLDAAQDMSPSPEAEHLLAQLNK